MRGFRRVRWVAYGVPLRLGSSGLRHSTSRSKGAAYSTDLGYVSIRVRISFLCPALARICRTAVELRCDASHSMFGLSAPGSRGKRRDAWVSWAWLFLLSAELLPQFKLDDVPHLFAVRYFPVGHWGVLLSCGYSKGPGGLLRRGPFCFSFYCNTITRGNYLSIYFTILHCATFKSFEGSVVQLVCVGDA